VEVAVTERTGIYRILGSSLIYEKVQRVMGGRYSDTFAHFVATMQLSPGDTVIDIGCGPGRLVPYIPASVRYTGFEPNSRYVDTARSQFKSRGEFRVGYFDAEAAAGLRNVDVAIVSAVLHHMSDAEAKTLYALLRQTLSPKGRVVSLDCVLHQGQHPVSRLLAKLDRGKHVRSTNEYVALAESAFERVDGRLFLQRFPPYSYWIMKASANV
jgi:SAM-dependent methyltransferase